VDFILAKGDGVVVTTGAIRNAKLQSNRHHQQTNRMNALPVDQQTVSALKGLCTSRTIKISHCG